MAAHVSDIKPINGDSKYSFKLSQFPEVQLSDWPTLDAKEFGWDAAKKEIARHWDILSGMSIWSPYPTLSYSLGGADAPFLVWDELIKNEINRKIVEMDIERNSKVHIRYFLFPIKNPEYQDQAVAQVMIEMMPNAAPGDFKAWVDALGNDELSPENFTDIRNAIRNLY